MRNYNEVKACRTLGHVHSDFLQNPSMMTLFPEILFLIILLIIYINNTGATLGNGCSDVCEVNQNGGIIDCQRRSLSQIPQECRTAKYLEMQDNLVGNLPRDSFRNFTRLQYLNLTNNNMTVEIGAFHGCHQLREFYLNHNHLPILNHALMKGLSGIIIMHIDHAEVMDIEPEAFADLGELELLSLKNNHLVTPPCTAFREDAVLEVLDLSDNSISNLPNGCFGRFPYLTDLLIQNNPLTYPNREAFKGLKSLEVLILQNTNLAEVPTGIFAYTNTIQWLNLAFNDIRHLSSRAFASLPELKGLYLQYNHIITIHSQSFEFLSSLKFLDLSHNSIISIGAGALEQCSELRELTLRNNLLQSIQNITLNVLTEDARINLANNPLHCDCSISPLWRRLKNSTEANNEHNATCSSPQKLPSRFITRLSESDICSEPRPTENHRGTTPLTGSGAHTSRTTIRQSHTLRITILVIVIGLGILGCITIVLIKRHIARQRKRNTNKHSDDVTAPSHRHMKGNAWGATPEPGRGYNVTEMDRLRNSEET